MSSPAEFEVADCWYPGASVALRFDDRAICIACDRLINGAAAAPPTAASTADTVARMNATRMEPFQLVIEPASSSDRRLLSIDPTGRFRYPWWPFRTPHRDPLPPKRSVC